MSTKLDRLNLLLPGLYATALDGEFNPPSDPSTRHRLIVLSSAAIKKGNEVKSSDPTDTVFEYTPSWAPDVEVTVRERDISRYKASQDDNPYYMLRRHNITVSNTQTGSILNIEGAASSAYGATISYDTGDRDNVSRFDSVEMLGDRLIYLRNQLALAAFQVFDSTR